MDIGRLGLASSIYSNVAVLHSGFRPAVHEPLAGPPWSRGPDEHATLQYLARSGRSLSPTAISGLLAVSRAAARQVISRLSKRGLIASRAEPEDRRLRSWYATEEGMADIARQLPTPLSDLPIVRALRSLPAGDLDRLARQLDTLVEGLEAVASDFGGAPAQDAPSSPGELSDFDAVLKLWFTFTRAYRRLRAEQTRFFQQQTNQILDTPSYMALYRAHETPSSMSEMAGFLRVDQNTATRMVDRLVSHELLRRARNSSSRREITISATRKGVALLESLPPVDPRGAFVGLLDRLSAGGTDLARLLDSCVANYIGGPVIDHATFYALLERVKDHAATRAPAGDGTAFRLAMSQFLTGVAVVTVSDGTVPRGMTVNSLTSVSLNPPILLVCFDRRSPSLRSLRQHKTFGVSILSKEQQHLASRFGRRETDDNPHTIEPELCDELDGVPTLAGSLVRMVCEFEQSFDAGTHTVVFGAPRNVALNHASPSSGALGFWQSRFVQVTTKA